MDDTSAQAAKTKKRPRLDLAVEPRERKRGKTAFGLVLGTLNRAKNEDRTRGASEAAKKRQLIEQRLQDKLRKETDAVRRTEEAKKDKTAANRKEEELQLQDSIHKLRRTRLPLLAGFLCTSDVVPALQDAEGDGTEARAPLAPVPRTHPPPLYYLPARLTPAQDAFLQRRKAEVKEAADQEWETFRAERAAGLEEIARLRLRVAEEDARRQTEREASALGEDAEMAEDDRPAKTQEEETMDMDDGADPKEVPALAERDQEVREDATPMQADDDDAVEY
ncbi:hypothetical protein B0H21DRAFT_703390 [Amylocystis lapponica]|nr:hypothetical protein B0H21DRAFT_703390 [Amylocystis lapponica]